jgi:hypothetical protein
LKTRATASRLFKLSLSQARYLIGSMCGIDPLTIFTCLLVVVGFLQFWILKQNRDAARGLERPWVGFSIVDDRGFEGLQRLLEDGGRNPPPASPIWVRFELANGGRVPARVVEGSITFGHVGWPAKWPAEPTYQPTQQREMLLLPNVPRREWIECEPFTPSQLEELRLNARRLLLFGFVRYEGLFGQTYETRFFMVRDPAGGFRLDGPRSYNRAV